MTLIELFGMLESGKITDTEAANSLGMTVTSFRSRRTRWGNRLPMLLSVLDRIRAGTITRSEAAAALSVTGREVNKLTESWSVVRPVKQYLLTRATSKLKWDLHKKHALDFISGSSSLEEASMYSGLDERSMRRWIAKLLERNVQMTWKDLKATPEKLRKSLADEIERAEDLNTDKMNVVRAIARGDMTLEEVALERVKARKAQGNKKKEQDV